MIYTITFNPALDYHVQVKNYQTGTVNRAESEQLKAGGKGLNVSTVLHHLGMETKALGFLAGLTGELIIRLLDDLPTDFITLPEGNSRINIKLHTNGKTETEINGSGAAIDDNALAALYEKLDVMQSGDILVLAGSVPANLPDTIYCDIMERLKDRGIRFAVDAAGELLRKSLAYRPFLVKPNHVELGELFGVRPTTPKEVLRYARKMQDMGAQNVLVSMGERGAMFINPESEGYFRRALQGKAVTATGAGDSMLAGFLTGWERYQNEPKAQHEEKALLMGIAAASASVFTGKLAAQEDTEKLYQFLLQGAGTSFFAAPEQQG